VNIKNVVRHVLTDFPKIYKEKVNLQLGHVHWKRTD